MPKSGVFKHPGIRSLRDARPQSPPCYHRRVSAVMIGRLD
jgi:hypothetical protein